MTTGREAGDEAAGRRAHPCPAVASYHPAMAAAFPITRRLFLVDLGRAGVAVTVLGLAGCATSASGSPSSGVAPSTSSSVNDGTDAGSPGSTSGSATDATSGGGSSGGASADGPTSWHRVDLGFVSAYVLARGGEAAVVDTGVPGNEGAILEALEAAGLGWSDVGHVILTHRHQDHVGSAPAVLDAAPGRRGLRRRGGHPGHRRPTGAHPGRGRRSGLRAADPRDARPHQRARLGPRRGGRRPRGR